MEQALNQLTQEQKRIARVNLALSLLTLVLGGLCIGFLTKYMGLAVLAVVLVLVVAYRAMLGLNRAHWEAELKRQLLIYGICKDFDSVDYTPRKGLDVQIFRNAGFLDIPMPKSDWFSVELTRAQAGALTAQMADVSFPLVPGSKKVDQRLTGCLIHMELPGANYENVTVRPGDKPEEVFPKQHLLLTELGKETEQGCYLRAHGDSLDVLLPGRILGFHPQKEKVLTEQSLSRNDFPEVHIAYVLAKKLARKD